MRLIDLRNSAVTKIARPAPSGDQLKTVRRIIKQVITGGDDALFNLTERLDGAVVDSLRVPKRVIEQATLNADPGLMDALRAAFERITAFAQHQALASWVAPIGGGLLGENINPVGRAGIYVPGGRAAYPSSVLMAAGPAKVAGVGEIALCVPPARDGSVNPATLAAAGLVGIEEVYRIGGAQAIAAMAFGTQTIKKTDVVVGPGNIYVALAKREVAGTVAIDSVAGPSEIAIVIDGSADPAVVACDLVAQAEHGPNGQLLLIAWDMYIVKAVEEEVDRLLDDVGASEALRGALDEGFYAGLVSGLDQAVDLVNNFAPEHLELIFDGDAENAFRFRNAGAVFIGKYSPVSIGDYFAGTNHVLPTGGAARWASGLRTSHFQKATSIVTYDRGALKAASGHIETLAGVEGLELHSRSVKIRLN